jgi:hypothetical protein
MKLINEQFNPGVIEMFMWKWTAEFYAWRARLAGYTTRVIYEGSNWIELGVRIDKPSKEKS